MNLSKIEFAKISRKERKENKRKERKDRFFAPFAKPLRSLREKFSHFQRNLLNYHNPRPKSTSIPEITFKSTIFNPYRT